eukprot:CAMPEP_0184478040 /NCGR_PEP_ID=MMETSP0113_2-20130426/151_1 /TAXON_ID=91329 /ORGANISM="Norrisiella sphaerica, Strain BC52" /LENGTH=191 /DNA_ID=CAMNT_0026855679 /DNA_START=150 /DNA_END=722 /DNA_ORIENTATION=+
MNYLETQMDYPDFLPLALGSIAAACGMSWLISRTEAKNKDHDFFLPEEQRFNGEKKLTAKDQIVVDMLSTHKDLCWVITDPDMKDNEIIFASPGFCRQTGYERDEIEGKNCRFLQGKDTDPKDVQKIRDAITKKEDTSVCILNYRKDGTSFYNQFFIMPMLDKCGKCLYYLGVQVEVNSKNPGQEPSNPGW